MRIRSRPNPAGDSGDDKPKSLFDLHSIDGNWRLLGVIQIASSVQLLQLSCVAFIFGSPLTRLLPDWSGPLSACLFVLACIIFAIQFVMPTKWLANRCRQLRERDPDAMIERLLLEYRRHVIVAWALCETAGITFLTAFMLNDVSATIVMTVLAAIAMIWWMPSRNDLAKWLKQHSIAMKDLAID
jgi:hypothetical protein